MSPLTRGGGALARARAEINARLTAFAERATDIDADATLFVRVLGILLCVTLGRLAVIALSGVPTFETGWAPHLALGSACLILSVAATRYSMAEATLALRAGAALGLSGFVFMTTCVDVFHIGRTFPLADQMFADMDARLGLDWLAYARVLDAHDALWTVTAEAYASIIPQFAAAIAILAFSRAASRLYTFLLAQTFSLCIVAAVAVFLPSIGAFAQHHGATAGFTHRFLTGDGMTAPILWLRSDLSGPGGVDVFTLISFPSYHACAAVLFVWAWWRVPYARWGALGLNLAMLAATPIHGSHYFVDVIAGAAIAGMTVAVAKALVAAPRRKPGIAARPERLGAWDVVDSLAT